jgi:putative flippase GtrA
MKPWQNRKLLFQLIRYIFTGGFVTLVSIAIYSGLVLLKHPKIQPNLAYGVTWLLCVGIGYVMHSRISFAGHGTRGDLRRTGGRFLIVNLIGLAINQSWVSLTLLFHLSALWANVPMASVTPLLTFTLHRYWAFR